MRTIQSPLIFGGAAPITPAPAAAVDAAAPNEDRAAKAARGTLTHGRQQDLARKENELLNLVHNWDNRAVVPQSTINKMKLSQKDLITETMKPVSDVLKKKRDLVTVKGQFRSLFETAAAAPFACYETNGKSIESLLTRVVGDMTPKELKAKINESTLGSLNKYLGMLRTFVAEEMDAKIRCATACPPVHACAQLLLLLLLTRVRVCRACAAAPM